MGSQDAAFMPARDTFNTIFIKNRSRGQDLGNVTSLKTVVKAKQGHAHCKIILLQQILFLCQSNFFKIRRLSQH